jgi:hypothetical protein
MRFGFLDGSRVRNIFVIGICFCHICVVVVSNCVHNCDAENLLFCACVCLLTSRVEMSPGKACCSSCETGSSCDRPYKKSKSCCSGCDHGGRCNGSKQSPCEGSELSCGSCRLPDCEEPDPVETGKFGIDPAGKTKNFPIPGGIIPEKFMLEAPAVKPDKLKVEGVPVDGLVEGDKTIVPVLPVGEKIPTPFVASKLTPDHTILPGGGAPNINDATRRALSRPGVKHHGVDGIEYIPKSDWDAGVWDGIPKDICGMLPADMCKYAFPKPNVMLGLQDLYNRVRPFKDHYAPTVAEIDQWNLVVLRHLRSLFGIKTPVEGDRCLYIHSVFAHEKKFSTKWDAKYPKEASCVGKGAHCGWKFKPDASEQTPYLEGGPPCDKFGAFYEGFFGATPDDPWSIKFANFLKGVVCSEGRVGHAGPLFEAKVVGIGYYFDGKNEFMRLQSSVLEPPCK